MRILLNVFLIGIFLFSSLGPLPAAQAEQLFLPKPGTMVRLSPKNQAPFLRGVIVNAKNPLALDFLIDPGNSIGHSDTIKEEANKLVKYFLASLTMPETDLWVNLSPYEKDRIIPMAFGQTEMGRDLLAQDYVLKQIMASLIHPKDVIGKEFWQRVYKTAIEKFGSTQIPINTFHKVWIVPGSAEIFEQGQTAVITKARLKVMLDEDYVAQEHNVKSQEAASKWQTEIIRQVVLPEVEREVNEGENFASLRQVYYSLVLADWYKIKIRNTILEQQYANKRKIQGIELAKNGAVNTDQIYQRYVQAFKKGVYNFVQEETDPLNGQVIPRKYFSGGMNMAMIGATSLRNPVIKINHDPAVLSSLPGVFLAQGFLQPDRAMRSSARRREEPEQPRTIVGQAGAVVSQADLPALYFDNIAGYITPDALSDVNSKISIAEQLSREFTPEASESENQRFQIQLMGQDDLGRTKGNIAVIMAAFITQQAIGITEESQKYTNVYLPRDMGLGYTIEKTIESLTGQTRDPQIYYVSRNSLTLDVYNRVSEIIDGVHRTWIRMGSGAQQRNQFLAEVGRRIMADDIAAPAAAKIKKELSDAGVLKKEAVRFVDTGFKTFPVMLQAIIAADPEISNIKTDGLVISSHLKQFLQGLNVNQWDNPDQRLVSRDRFKPYAGSEEALDRMENDGQMLHPIAWDPESGRMVLTDARTQREAYGLQAVFMYGTKEYFNIIEEIKAELEGLGYAREQLSEIAARIFAEGIGFGKIPHETDNLYGVHEAGVSLNLLKKQEINLGDLFKENQAKIQTILTQYKPKLDLKDPGKVFNSDKIFNKILHDKENDKTQEFLKTIKAKHNVIFIKDFLKERLQVDLTKVILDAESNIMPQKVVFTEKIFIKTDYNEEWFNYIISHIPKELLTDPEVKNLIAILRNNSLLARIMDKLFNTKRTAHRKLLDLIEAHKASSSDKAQLGQLDPGGVDFNTRNLDLKVQKGGAGVQMQMDPAQLNGKEIQGLTPVIIDIKPMSSIEYILSHQPQF